MRFVSFTTQLSAAPRAGMMLSLAPCENNEFASVEPTSVLDLGLYFGVNYRNLTEFIDRVTEVQLEELSKIIASEPNSQELAVKKRALFQYNECSLLAPIILPKHDIICVGLNYKDHLEEIQKSLDPTLKAPEAPAYFGKRACEVKGPNAELTFRDDLDKVLDYEVELAVIIGKSCKDVSKEDALDYVFGYSIFNDLSARTLQKKHLQWFKGKSLDGLSALGPWIIHKSALQSPYNLEISLSVNGEARQHSNTNQLIHDISTIISNLSEGMTLEAGDIIATGTPAGVGISFTPPRTLHKGDNVECKIQGIGTLSNNIV